MATLLEKLRLPTSSLSADESAAKTQQTKLLAFSIISCLLSLVACSWKLTDAPSLCRSILINFPPGRGSESKAVKSARPSGHFRFLVQGVKVHNKAVKFCRNLKQSDLIFCGSSCVRVKERPFNSLCAIYCSAVERSLWLSWCARLGCGFLLDWDFMNGPHVKVSE